MHFVVCFFLQVLENKEDLKAELKKLLKEKSDVFNSENPEGDKVLQLLLLLIYVSCVYVWKGMSINGWATFGLMNYYTRKFLINLLTF